MTRPIRRRRSAAFQLNQGQNLNFPTSTVRAFGERDWYRRSLAVWQELNSGGKLKATDAENINLIQSELDKCDAMLAKL